MKTPLDCLVCFMSQAVRGAALACPDDADAQRDIVLRASEMFSRWNLNEPPPAQAVHLNRLICEVSGLDDLFRDEKVKANTRVLELLPQLRHTVRTGHDPLRAALEVSIIGNYIDCGVVQEFDWEAALEKENNLLDEVSLSRFRERLVPGARVVILGDNAGEIGLDTLLVSQLSEMGCKVTYAVRSAPVLNDATLADAAVVGMDRLCEVVESGSDAPGTVLSRITDEFRTRMDEADVLLSKGQGNFESLYGEWADVFFAFKVKCPIVMKITGEPVGSSIFRWSGLDFAHG